MRALAILARPAPTWEAIAADPADARRLYARHVAPLAAIPAVCGLAGPLIFAFDLAGVRLRPDALALTLQVATSYLLTLAGVWLLALWIDLLAPVFGGVRDFRRALNLVGYAGTAAWLAGAFALYPDLGLPAALLAGLYSAYTLNLGLPQLMQAPEERRLTYFAAILFGALLLIAGQAWLSAEAAALGGPLSLG